MKSCDSFTTQKKRTGAQRKKKRHQQQPKMNHANYTECKRDKQIQKCLQLFENCIIIFFETYVCTVRC